MGLQNLRIPVSNGEAEPRNWDERKLSKLLQTTVGIAEGGLLTADSLPKAATRVLDMKIAFQRSWDKARRYRTGELESGGQREFR